MSTPQDAFDVQRFREVIELRSTGMTFNAIAAELGFSRSAVHRWYVAGRAQMLQETKDLHKRLLLQDLAWIEDRLSQLEDKIDSGNLQALAAAMALIDRRAKWLGYERVNLDDLGELTPEQRAEQAAKRMERAAKALRIARGKAAALLIENAG